MAHWVSTAILPVKPEDQEGHTNDGWLEMKQEELRFEIGGDRETDNLYGRDVALFQYPLLEAFLSRFDSKYYVEVRGKPATEGRYAAAEKAGVEAVGKGELPIARGLRIRMD